MPKAPMPDVVVLIPGITGSRLQRGDRILWGFSPAVLAKALLTSSSFCRDLTPEPGDVADAALPDLTFLPGFWKIDGYTKVAERIQADFAVEADRNFFIFPYDWRLDNRIAAHELARRCHEWLGRWRETAKPQAKLILVAHSMGGLIARYFLEVLEGWKETRALITFGTPYRGSLHSVDTLLLGLRKGPLGLIDLTAVARMLPSIYQLLPTYPCLDIGDGGPLKRFSEVAHPPYVDASLVADAQCFHQEIRDAVDAHLLDSAYFANRYRVHPVVGIDQTTFQFARIANGKTTMLTEHNGENHGGDGTVPRVSATPLEYRDLDKEMFTSTKHGSIQNADAVLTQLKGVITGRAIDWDRYQRAVPSGTVSLMVEDVYWNHEDIILRAEPSGTTGALYATVIDSTSSMEVARMELRPDADGRLSASFGALTASAYEVTVSGAGIEPVKDSFVVAAS